METYKHKPGVAAGVIILNDKQEIFLMQRSAKTTNDHGMWSIPGGKVEFNETVEGAVRRECLEECGVVLEEIQHLGYVDHILKEYEQHWVPQVFFAKTWFGVAENKEPENFDKVAWFALDDIPSDSSQVVIDGVKLLNVPRRTFEIGNQSPIV